MGRGIKIVQCTSYRWTMLYPHSASFYLLSLNCNDLEEKEKNWFDTHGA